MLVLIMRIIIKLEVFFLWGVIGALEVEVWWKGVFIGGGVVNGVVY